MSELRLNGIEILVPTIEAAASVDMAPRLATLHDKMLGYLWNSRPHGPELFRLIVDRLKEKYRIKGTVVVQKPYLGNIAPEDRFSKLAESCDAVVCGFGD